MGACDEDKKNDLKDYWAPRVGAEFDLLVGLFPDIKCLNDDDMYI